MTRTRFGRLLSAAGLVAIPLLVFADTGSGEEVNCWSFATEECPDAAATLTMYREGDIAASCPVVAVLGEAERERGDCCYTVQMECEELDTGRQRLVGGCY